MARKPKTTKRVRKIAKADLFTCDTYFIPYRMNGMEREYINRFAQFPKDTRIAQVRLVGIPQGAWIKDHGNGSRVLSFTNENDAVEFAQFFSFDIAGIETLTVATENQWV